MTRIFREIAPVAVTLVGIGLLIGYLLTGGF